MSGPPSGDELVAAAREYLGTPFFHAGRRKGLGVDCIGVVIGALRDLGVLQFDDRNYSYEIDPEHLRRRLEQFCDRIETTEVRAGDLLVFTVRGVPQHVGIYTGTGLLHAHAGVGRVVEHRYAENWARRLAAVYRFRGMA